MGQFVRMGFLHESETRCHLFYDRRQRQRQFKGMDLIKTKRGRTKIYTIGYGAPTGAKKPLEEIAAMSGGKSKFVDMDEIRAMEKEIDKNPPK